MQRISDRERKKKKRRKLARLREGGRKEITYEREEEMKEGRNDGDKEGGKEEELPPGGKVCNEDTRHD